MVEYCNIFDMFLLGNILLVFIVDDVFFKYVMACWLRLLTPVYIIIQETHELAILIHSPCFTTHIFEHSFLPHQGLNLFARRFSELVNLQRNHELVQSLSHVVRH